MEIGIQNVDIISNDSITLGGNLNWVKDLLIRANGSTELGGHFRADGTKFYVQDQLKFNGHLALYDETYIYVHGDNTAPAVWMTGNNNDLIIDNSTLCINGNLHAKAKLDVKNNGKLIVKGAITGFDYNKPGVTANISDSVFKSLCGESVEEPVIPTIEFGDDISRDIDYDY